MEPHPIPQNVTTFQFHLIGDMTLKQFLFLAIGAGIAYIVFVFFAASYPLISWPLIIISTILGVAFAFLPINSRPLDYWVIAFLKAIYSPTNRVWKKNGQTYRDDPLYSSRLVMYLSSMQPKEPTLQTTPPLSNPLAPTPEELPTKDELGKTVDLARQAQNLQFKIIQTERTLGQIKSQAQNPHTVPSDYSEQVNKILADLNSLVSQASEIRSQIDVVTKSPPMVEQKKPQQKIKVVIPEKPKQTQLALTTFPNVINGVIRDKIGSYLEGVIAVIYDKEGLPVRALKTNKLGQFSGSTPLPNGTYTLELEREGLTFDVLQLELGGQVLPPLLITAK